MSKNERVIQVMGLADGRHTQYDGWFVREYDPDGNDGMGHVDLTPNSRAAKVFASFEEAWAAWKAPSRVRPRRPDGAINRPLTAFNIQIASPPEQAQ